MFLLFASTSDVEQMGLQLSLESVQSSLVSSSEHMVDVCVLDSLVCNLSTSEGEDADQK